MKRIMIVGLIVMGFIACNDNGTTNSGDTTQLTGSLNF